MIAPTRCYRPNFTIHLLLLLIAILSINLSLYAAERKKVARSFSMVYKDQPLKEVLNIASKATGCQIYINKEYAATSVSGEFYDAPIHLGLKIIVSRLNHTITYDRGNRISIVIYEKIPPDPSTIEFIPAYLGPRDPLPEIPFNSDLDESDLDESDLEKIALLAESLPAATLKKIMENKKNVPLSSFQKVLDMELKKQVPPPPPTDTIPEGIHEEADY